MSVLLQVPVDEQTALLVEVDRTDIPQGVALASLEPGVAVAKASRSLGASLEQLQPWLREIKDRLQQAAPDHFVVEFGVKFGGEAGIIVAKGTAEVNLKISMTWDRTD